MTAHSLGALPDNQDLTAVAKSHVLAQLHATLPAALQKQAQIDIAISGARGAAQRPCPSGWQWEPLDVTQWQRLHVALTCAGERGSVVARVRVKAPVFVSAQALDAEHTLRPQDLKTQVRAIRSAGDALALEQLVGMQLRRTVPAEQVLQAQHLQRVLYAKKGQRLDIQAQAGGITVSAPGIALRNGYQGERIRARNPSSQTWVEGVLVAPGVLQADTTQPGRGVKVQSID